jgi:hypothetical protein
MKVPVGGDVRPKEPSPQQATAPDVLSPQLWYVPVLTELKVPNGGASAGTRRSYLQHSSVPVVLTPQLCEAPALTLLKVPMGAGICR